MTTDIPTKYDDTIDSRDVIAAIEYYNGIHHGDHGVLNGEEREEYNALCELSGEGESFDDWRFGCTLIRDSYFKEYAMDLAEDIGAIDDGNTIAAKRPYTCIDWDQAARELKLDYSSIEFAGTTYLIRR